MTHKDVMHQLPSYNINHNKLNELYTFYRRTKLINFKNYINPGRFLPSPCTPIAFKSSQYLKLLVEHKNQDTTTPFSMSLLALGFLI